MNSKWNEDIWILTKPNEKAGLTILIDEVGSGTNIQSNQACILPYYKSYSKTLATPASWLI